MNDGGLEAMNISFLRGHVVQLTQSISASLKVRRIRDQEKGAGLGGSGREDEKC
jgi:hypothetical protein